MEFLLNDDQKSVFSDIGLLILRLWAGLTMFFAHGFGKIENFGGVAENFDGLLGLPGEVNAVLVIFSEVLCALLIAAGALTRAAAVPLVITMLVATYSHAILWDDPFGDYELALTFGSMYLALIFTGPGKYSIDTLIAKSMDSK